VFQNPDNQLFMPTVWEDIAFGPMNLGLRDQELREQFFRRWQQLRLTQNGMGNTDNLSGEKRNELQSRVY